MKDAFSVLNQMDAGIVLDAATGRGEFINVLKQNLKTYIQIIGVDSSQKSVDHAQKLFPENNVEIYCMDLENLEFEDDYFDFVAISNSLHHLENIPKVFFELRRVLKPGGNFLITEMYSDGEQSEAQKTHILLHHWLASIDRMFGTYHHMTYTKEELLNIINGLNLKKVNTVDFYQPVDNPKEAKNCESLKRNCNESFKRLENIKENTALINEGKALIERINKVGCASSSRLLITGVNSPKQTEINAKRS